MVFDSHGRIDLRTVFEIRRFLRSNQIDILHSHGYKSDIVGFMAASLAKTVWVATNHVWHPMSGKLRLYEGVDAFVLRFARRIVAVSCEVREALIAANIESANIRVIENGIDLDRFTPSRQTEFLRSMFGMREHDVIVTIVGRLSPEKGHKTFLEAARTIASGHDNVKFLIVGDGPMEEELRIEAARLNLGQRVVFAGFRGDMPEIYGLSDVMVNASSIEGLPMTILEAMASRVPVVAARTGGIPGIIKDGETGLLVDSGDVGALSTRIESLIEDPGRRRQLASAAFEFVTVNHSLKRMCDSYWQVYQEAMDRPEDER